jgi:putative aldouronate transport system substrate-binding protein
MKWAMTKHPELYEDGYLNAVYLPLPSAGKYLAELEKIRDETYYGIITGEKPLDAFDAFVKEWKEVGGDILTKEANIKY